MASSRTSTTTALVAPLAAGGAIGIGLIGVGFTAWAAALVGVGSWALGVLFVRRRARSAATPQRPRIDPFALSEPWRRYVQRAQSAKLRYDRTVQSTRDGPMRERLASIGGRLDQGVDDCWRIASRGHDIDGARSNLDVGAARRDLTAVEAQLASATEPRDSLTSTADSLRSRIAAADRMQKVSDDARDRLRLLDARLNEILATATEVSVGTTDTSALTDDVDGLLAELDSLRAAMEEVDRAGRSDLPGLPPSTPPTPPTPPTAS